MRELVKITSIVLIAFGIENIISPFMPAWLMVILGLTLYFALETADAKWAEFIRVVKKN